MDRTGSDAGDNRKPFPLFRTASLLVALLMGPGTYAATEPATDKDSDPHYSDAGFFDIHVCNWPGRPLFFMPLFSTARFNEVRKITVFTPTGEVLVELDLDRYRTIRQEKKPDKRVFIQQVEVSPTAIDGWYSARIILTNGDIFTARDYVILHKLLQASGQVPANEVEMAETPTRLSWDPVPGANFYQVFIRDLWNDGKLVYTSELLGKPELRLPPGVLESGGYYSWIIHARDTDVHILLGDFNHGSLNTPATFSVAESPGSL
jgi:hypothetical protein